MVVSKLVGHRGLGRGWLPLGRGLEGSRKGISVLGRLGMCVLVRV